MCKIFKQSDFGRPPVLDTQAFSGHVIHGPSDVIWRYGDCGHSASLGSARAPTGALKFWPAPGRWLPLRQTSVRMNEGFSHLAQLLPTDSVIATKIGTSAEGARWLDSHQYFGKTITA